MNLEDLKYDLENFPDDPVFALIVCRNAEDLSSIKKNFNGLCREVDFTKLTKPDGHLLPSIKKFKTDFPQDCALIDVFSYVSGCLGDTDLSVHERRTKMIYEIFAFRPANAGPSQKEIPNKQLYLIDEQTYNEMPYDIPSTATAIVNIAL